MPPSDDADAAAAADRFAALYASDLAGEVRDEFEERVGHGLPVAEATAAVVERFAHALHDPDDGPVILLVTAALQLHHGRLDPAFRDAALDLIADGSALRAHAGDGGEVADRRRVLAELEEALRMQSEQWAGTDLGPEPRT